MAITAALVEATGYMLKYLLTQDGVSAGSPTVDSFLVIPNNGGATPDLRTDALTGAAAEGHGKLQEIIRARIDGYGPIAAGALSQAQARALLSSDDATNAVLTNRNIMSCQMYVTPRTQVGSGGVLVGGQAGSGAAWLCDATVDASGDPVVQVGTARRPPAVGTCYLTIHLRHSMDH